MASQIITSVYDSNVNEGLVQQKVECPFCSASTFLAGPLPPDEHMVTPGCAHYKSFVWNAPETNYSATFSDE